MGVVELLDLSAAAALEHASAVQDRLRAVDEPDAPAIQECQAQMHRLVGDIISLRNAAELLKREAATEA
ncbi:hypothetical protein ASC77_02800 [Nocardioides sp. Root1257]|uniref:hypothetical protein n=1 Tax=unclassified Nocardioides TaxID=2615069 RepID=UPI0006F92158|nr:MULTISPECIES: hypothetical protein [unclassified Nocardioides]KQW53239.1 hypothetical protein ASC77_02800 [Nocardioides sp. Root1257]KRC55925.1 hypothetical protein ASE24_02800 [Nocardioides sp. Root224]